MNVPENLLYTREHEWVRIEGKNAIIGISDHAQSALGDITYVELPKVSQEVAQFKQYASVESVKVASDVYAPVSGKITGINEELIAHPEFINQAPYEKGWFAVVEMNDPVEKDTLMSPEDYTVYIQGLHK